MAQSSSNEVYLPLRREHREIRLLRIHDGDGIVKCTLKTFSIKATPRYRALSYEWGSADRPRPIKVNGQPLCVRRNLYDFLYRTRDNTYHWGWWWIDAICVNQNDVGEQGHQVSMICEIYSQAAMVIAWLGPSRDDSQLALKKIHIFDENLETPSKWSTRSCRAVIALCERTYWTRLWVLQELTTSHHTVLKIGDNECHASILENFVYAVKRGLLEDYFAKADLWQALVQSPAISMMIEASKPGTNVSLLKRILSSGHLGCMKLHDRVFAVLNISNPRSCKNVEPDYKIGIRKLLHTVICDDLSHHNYTITDANYIWGLVEQLDRLMLSTPLGLHRAMSGVLSCDESKEGRQLARLFDFRRRHLRASKL